MTPANTTPPLDHLQGTLGYHFKDVALLELSLRHPSCAQEDAHAPTNQRLEFLGDAVIGMVLAEALYKARPDDREGALTQARSALARGKQLSLLALDLGLPEALITSASEREQGGHQRPAALEDALEAIAGAIYLDGGIDAAKACVLQWFGDLESLLAQAQPKTNAKGRLQEYLQGKGQPTPAYRLTNTSGPDHDRSYTSEVWFDGKAQGKGAGSSIKSAEEAAALQALSKIPAEELAAE